MQYIETRVLIFLIAIAFLKIASWKTWVIIEKTSSDHFLREQLKKDLRKTAPYWAFSALLAITATASTIIYNRNEWVAFRTALYVSVYVVLLSIATADLSERQLLPKIIDIICDICTVEALVVLCVISLLYGVAYVPPT